MFSGTISQKTFANVTLILHKPIDHALLLTFLPCVPFSLTPDSRLTSSTNLFLLSLFAPVLGQFSDVLDLAPMSHLSLISTITHHHFIFIVMRPLFVTILFENEPLPSFSSLVGYYVHFKYPQLFSLLLSHPILSTVHFFMSHFIN